MADQYSGLPSSPRTVCVSAKGLGFYLPAPGAWPRSSRLWPTTCCLALAANENSPTCAHKTGPNECAEVENELTLSRRCEEWLHALACSCLLLQETIVVHLCRSLPVVPNNCEDVIFSHVIRRLDGCIYRYHLPALPAASSAPSPPLC